MVTAAQGTTDAADAVAKMRADGFPSGSTIFLDIERVNTVSPALLAYYRAWMVEEPSCHRPGVYVTKLNAPAVHDAQIRSPSGAPYAPAFWIASTGAVDSTTAPSDIGLDYAQIWQHSFDVTLTFSGVSLRIDMNVATKPNPGTP